MGYGSNIPDGGTEGKDDGAGMTKLDIAGMIAEVFFAIIVFMFVYDLIDRIELIEEQVDLLIERGR